MAMDIYGTDINSDWSFTGGDIDLISDTSNLGQAILNRLNSDSDTYDIFYNKYGGELFEHMGDLNHPTIHEYIRIEIEAVLSQEPRIKNVECTVNKTDTKTIKCELKIHVIDNTEPVTLNLILGDGSPILIDANNELADRS